MAFPTIPTVAASRVLTGVQADANATRTFPNLSGLTKNSGDLLIAICAAYQTTAAGGSAWSGWSAGWTEFIDFGGGNTSCGAAYRISDGTETGTISVTEAATITGHAAFILLSIPGAHSTTAPEAGTIVRATTTIADPAALNPAGWDAEDTLWIVLAIGGETSTTGSWTGVQSATAPTNYSDIAITAQSGDVVGGTDAAVAFRQLNATSEDPGPYGGVDTSNARNAAIVIAVRPAAATPSLVWQPAPSSLYLR